jgi:uncharacterized protein
MALVHVTDFSNAAHTPEWFTEWLLVGQSRTIFTLLFGVSFGLQISRSLTAGEPQQRFLARFGRRLLVLWLVFGLFCHAFFGNGILLQYATFGLLLPLLYGRRRSVLLAVSVLCFVIPRLHPVLERAYAPEQRQTQRLAWENETAPLTAKLGTARSHGDAVGVFVATTAYDLRTLARWRSYLADLPALGLMIIGMLVVRGRVLDSLTQLRSQIVAFGVVAACCWGLFQSPGIPLRLSVPGLGSALGSGGGLLFPGWLSFAYVAFTLAVWAGTEGWHARVRGWLRVVAPLGRMALTWFVAHQFILLLLFTPFGANLTFPSLWRIPIWIALTAIMIAGSIACLRRMKQGPLEWLWRTLSELRVAPLRPVNAPLSPAVTSGGE